MRLSFQSEAIQSPKVQQNPSDISDLHGWKWELHIGILNQ